MVNHGVYLHTFRMITGNLGIRGTCKPRDLTATKYGKQFIKQTYIFTNSIRKISPIAMAAQIFGRNVAVLKNALALLLFKKRLFTDMQSQCTE